RHRTFIGDGHIDARLAACRRDGAQSRERPAGELHGRPSRRQIDHAHVAPKHARAQPGAESLGAGLLGGETLSVGLGPSGPALGFCPLDRGEDASEKALAVPLDRAFGAADIDEIGAHTKDHARPRSIAARMVFTASARPQETASPIKKWPMLSSTTSGSAAIASAVAKLRPWPAGTSRPRRRASCAPWRRRPHPARAPRLPFAAHAPP